MKGRDQQAQRRVDVVGAQPLDEAVQRLLVREYRGDRDAQARGELALAVRGDGAEQERRQGGDLRGLAQVVRPAAHRQHVT